MTRRYAIKFLQIDDPNPSVSEVKKAFRKLASTFHPDKNNAQQQAVYNNLFQQLNESYSVLTGGAYESDEEAIASEREFLRSRKQYITTQRKKNLEELKRKRIKEKSKKGRQKKSSTSSDKKKILSNTLFKVFKLKKNRVRK